MGDVYIIVGIRTTLGKHGKSLASYSVIDLVAAAIKGVKWNADIEPTEIQEVGMRNVIGAGPCTGSC